MAYIVPRVLIQQEFTQVPVFGDQPLAALVFGPQYNLYRYSVDDEKPTTKVLHPSDATLSNKYQKDSDVTYTFPNQAIGTYVDKDFVKVHFEKAQIEYYPNDLASTEGAVTRIQVPNSAKYYPNRFKASHLTFKTANGFDRSADFSFRNVEPGDIIVLSSDDDDATFTTKVKTLHYSKTDPVTAAATYDTGNTATVATDINDAVVVGTGNTGTNVVIANETNTFKGGWVDGAFIGVETFTATVVTGGTLSQVRFDITSEHGLVGSESTSTVALASLTDVDELSLYTKGTNIVKLDFTNGSGTPGFVVGDTYSLTVTAPKSHTYVPTSGGVYTGSQNITYKLSVVRGGPFYDPTANTGLGNADVCARVAVTSNAIDSSATVNVQAGVAFPVGSYGVTGQFATQSNVYGGLVAGDIYYIVCSAAAPARTDILETYDTLPLSFTSGATTDWEIASMRFQKDYDVSQLIPDNDVDFNWEVDDDAQTIVINNGITASDPYILLGDQPYQLDVISANIYVTHRDLVVTNSISIGSLNDPSLVDETLGTIHPDNPIAQGVYDALLNSNGVSVYFCTVRTNDLEGYDTVLSLARKQELYYGLVPLTFDRAVQDAVIAHVNAMSTPENAKWRVAWISAPLEKTSLVYDVQEDLTDWLGTLTDDPLIADSNPPTYTLLTVPGATFITDGVRATDQVLINFRTNAAGKVVSDIFTVAEVRTETQLVTTTGSSVAINVPVKVQIKRVYTKDEQIDKLSLVGSEYNNRRVRAVFPESAKEAGVVKPGYLLAAAGAGLRSGVVPHQGLTNTQLLGVDDLTEAIVTFDEDQMNRLADQGYWIFTQATVGATPYVRHQLTTDHSSLNTSEDSITTNVDSISYGLRRALEPYIGKYNINRGSLAMIRATIFNELQFRLTSTYTVRAGNQLNGFTIVKVEQNATFKDRVDAEVILEVPYPINFITVKLIV